MLHAVVVADALEVGAEAEWVMEIIG